MDDGVANLHDFELLLDDSRFASSATVDLKRLRDVCAEGIPNHPSHIRPLSYALLLGTLPKEKKAWKRQNRHRREKYYDLVRALTDESLPLQAEDDRILNSLAKDIHSQVTLYPFLTHPSLSRSKRNGLRPFPSPSKLKGKADYEDDESTSSSSGSEAEGGRRPGRGLGEDDFRRDEMNVEVSEGKQKTSAAAGSTTTEKKQRERGSVAHIQSRRRLFDRLRDIQIEKDRNRGYPAANALKTNSGLSAQTGYSVDSAHGGAVDTPDRSGAVSPASSQSPAIILSADKDESVPLPAKSSAPRLKGPRLRQPTSKESLLRAASPTIQLTHDNPDEDSHGGDTPKSITLVGLHEIVQSPVDVERQRKERALARQDTHGECLLRMMYIFLKTNRGWQYRSEMVDIARTLYTLYASGGDVAGFSAQSSQLPAATGTRRNARPGSASQAIADLPSNGWSRHAEAETYFALVELLNEAGDAFTESSGGDGWWGEKLARRIKWADEGLYEILRSKRLSPATNPIFYRWAHTLFADLGSPALVLALWDLILANDEPTRYYAPATEAVIDIATALLVLIKEELVRDNAYPTKSHTRDLWGSEMAEQVVFDLKEADRPEHERKTMRSREAAIISRYPLEQVGVAEVCRIAREIRHQRLLGAEDGDGPEDMELSEEEEVEEEAYIEESKIRSKLQDLAAEAGNNVARQLSYAQARSASLPSTQSLRHSLSVGEKLFKQYMTSAQDSDAAAQAAKITTNLSAAALARWDSTTRPGTAPEGTPAILDPAEKETRPSSGEWRASKYLSLLRGGAVETPAAGAIAGEEFADAANDHSPASSRPISPEPTAGANLQRRDTNLPPSFFLSPRGSIVYTKNPYQNKATRGQGTRPTLQQRLAAAASTTAAPPPPSPAPAGSSTVRPLLLSASARPASPAHSVRSSRSTRSNSISSATSGQESPSGHPSPSDSMKSMEYDRAPSRKVPLRRASGEGTMPVSAFGAARAGLKRGGGGDMSSGDKLRIVTDGGSQSGAEGQREGRYQLFDTPVLASLSGETSRESEMVSLGDGRSKAVRRPRVMARPGGLKLRTASGHRSAPGSTSTSTEDLGGLAHRSSLEMNMPSPLLEELSPTTPRAKQSGFAPPQSPSQIKRSQRMSTLPAQPVETNVQIPPVGGDTPERLKNQKDGYGDLLASYGSLDI